MRYLMTDGSTINTNRATHLASSRPKTNSKWNQRDLYRSRHNRYFVIHTQRYHADVYHAEWINETTALLCLHDNLEWDLCQDQADQPNRSAGQVSP